MASIGQLVSEFAHELGQPNNYALRSNIRSLIIHTRNELIRHSYGNHNYVDRGLVQRYRVSITDVNDGDVNLENVFEGFDNIDINNIDIAKVKRTLQKVPRPVRLTNNLPFDRVSTVGYRHNREFPFIKETSARFRSLTPGLKGMPAYDYINGYIYIFPNDDGCSLDNIGKIVIESAFEHPNVIEIANGETSAFAAELDENEWLLPEDMIGNIKDIINKRDLLQTVRQNNEIPDNAKFI